MSQAEELLNAISVDEVATVSSPYVEVEPHIVIGLDRFIKVPDSLKRIAVQYDHNMRTVTFDCPRYYDGRDMSEMYVYINIMGPKGARYGYIADNVRVDADDENMMHFDWTINRPMTDVKGSLAFLVCVRKADSDGNEENHWNSELNTELYISEGMEYEETFEYDYPDIVSQLLDRQAAVEAIATPEAMQGYTDAWLVENSDTVMAEIEDKGVEVLESIPEDYTESYNLSNEAARTKGDAVVCTTQGETITVSDSSDDYLRGLRVFGKSIQDGEPSPETPVSIVSREINTISIRGKNLIDINNPVRLTSCTAEVNNNQLLITKTNTSAVYSNVYFTAGAYSQYAGKTLTFKITNVSEYPWVVRVGNMISNSIVDSGNLALISLHSGKTETVTFVVPELSTGEELGVRITSSDNSISDNSTHVLKDIQLEISSDATEYEPCVTTQSISTAHTLHGIPVNQNGNYTDENGQQWICDEVDFERGMYIQRVGEYVVTGNENWERSNLQLLEAQGLYRYDANSIPKTGSPLADALVTHFPYASSPNYVKGFWIYNDPNSRLALRVMWNYSTVEELKAFLSAQYSAGTPVIVKYALAAPNEIQLTASELQAFKYLCSNYPNTTVINDSGAWMEMKYNADTKTYVDNSIRASIIDILEAIENGSY